MKPDSWDETQPEYIEDASATKPEGWLEDEDELVPDPDAEKPGDWSVCWAVVIMGKCFGASDILRCYRHHIPLVLFKTENKTQNHCSNIWSQYLGTI